MWTKLQVKTRAVPYLKYSFALLDFWSCSFEWQSCMSKDHGPLFDTCIFGGTSTPTPKVQVKKSAGSNDPSPPKMAGFSGGSKISAMFAAATCTRRGERARFAAERSLPLLPGYIKTRPGSLSVMVSCVTVFCASCNVWGLFYETDFCICF